VRRAARFLKRPVLTLVVCAALLIVAGAVYAVAAGKAMQHSIAYALFIGGAVLVVVAGLAGGGASGARFDTRASGRYQPADMPFGWVVIGALVIGIGVAVLKA
jgi:hypothetical protein